MTKYFAIQLTGMKQSGKDTIGNYLCNNYNFVRYAYADKLKKIAKKLGWSGTKDKAGRQFLIDLGEAIRSVDPDFFCRAVWDTVDPKDIFKVQGKQGIVITDCRYSNEYMYTASKLIEWELDYEIDKAVQHYLLNVVNPNAQGTPTEKKSIKKLIEWKNTNIDNSNTIENLYANVDKYMNRIGAVKLA